MEKFEQGPSEEQLIELLKSPEAAKSAEFLVYVEKRESEAGDSKDSIRIATSIAILYFKAGFKKESWESLNECREMANNEQDQELLAEIDSIMDGLENS